jgi:hypothetical protein
LQLCYDGTFRDKSQEHALPGKGKGHDQRHEDDHLKDKKSKDETVVERHGGQLMLLLFLLVLRNWREAGRGEGKEKAEKEDVDGDVDDKTGNSPAMAGRTALKFLLLHKVIRHITVDSRLRANSRANTRVRSLLSDG